MTPTHTDREKASAYAAAAAAMRADARSFVAIAANVIPNERYATFSQALANRLISAYEGLADVFAEAAEQADSIAADYAAHADGTYEPLGAA